MSKSTHYIHPKPTKIEKFLWWCCGADKQLLQKSTYADYAKYSGLGGIVLGTGILAFLGMSFAMYRVFLNDGSNPTMVLFAAVTVGIIWALLIFNLDRFVVSSTGKGDGKHSISWSEFGGAIPRIIMAALIGVTVSGPLEVYIFQKEIDKQWEVHKLEQKGKAQASSDTIKVKEFVFIEANISALTEEKKILNARIAVIEPQIDYQINHGGCKDKCQALQKERDEKRKQVLEKEDLIKIENQKLDGIRKEREAIVSAIDKKNSGKLGILDSIKALHDYPGSEWPVWLVRLLFVFIEVAPVFFKLMIAYSPYDYITDNTKYKIFATNGIQAKEGYTHLENGNIYDQIVYHEADYLYKDRMEKLLADEDLMKQIIAKYKAIESKNIDDNPQDYIKNN